MSRAFVFPGQGSQFVGMADALVGAFPAARETLEQVDEALHQNLSKLIREGPEDALTLTENAQPALMAVSLAVLTVLMREGGIDLASQASCVAGHSLGEYSALAAAGSLSIEDAARLLKTRGRAMQDAVPVGQGAMAALLGADLDRAETIAEAASAAGVCEVANDNAPGQVVLSGSRTAIDRAIELAPEHGVRRAMLLPVSAPFHCSLLEPAAETMAQALAEVDLKPPVVPLIANVSAERVSDPEAIGALLVEQVTRRVRWRESVLAMREDGVDTLVELGAGKVLTNLAKRIEPELAALSVGTPDDVEAFLKTV